MVKDTAKIASNRKSHTPFQMK